MAQMSTQTSTATASIQTISVYVDAAHTTDPDKVEEIRQAIRRGDTLPLPLVVECVGNGATVLDGHHRIRAYREEGIDRIEALVVTWADLNPIIEREFDGEWPNRLSDLDDYIVVDGAPYATRT